VVDGAGKLTVLTEIQVSRGRGRYVLVSSLNVIDWVKMKTFEERNSGISWRFTEKVEDLSFVDDLALLSN